MVLVAYRHGLRAAEVVALRWDFGRGELHVSRVKKGTPSVHPISGRELRMLRRLPQDSARLGAAGGLSTPPILSSSGMAAGSSLPPMATTRARCRLTSGTRTLRTRCDTPSSRRRGSAFLERLTVAH